jgi:hypothetical protein
MEESVATEVVELLRARRFFAHVNRRVGVYNVGVRLVIPDGREVIWDNDGAAGLEAMVLRDGDLVGYVPQVPDSDSLDAAAIATLIAETDYDAPPAPSTPSNPTSGRSRSSSARSGTPERAATPASPAPPSQASPASPAAPAAPASKSRWTDRLRRRTD